MLNLLGRVLADHRTHFAKRVLTKVLFVSQPKKFLLEFVHISIVRRSYLKSSVTLDKLDRNLDDVLPR